MSDQPKSPESNTPSPTASSGPWPLPDLAAQPLSYWVDAWQRTILFWDVLRQRSDQYYAQKAKAVPHVLSFDAELVLDGRTFDRPVNYGLVRIEPPEGVVIDPKKRPFVVVDPRAGHGPGIGGFKADSELGVALRAGHPCYFVGFTPDPMPGQTIEDVMHAEAVFMKVLDRDAALATIPKMLPADAEARTKMLAVVRTVAAATGDVTGERAERLAQIEKLFGEEIPGITGSTE